MTIYVDIDNTICFTKDTDYKNATPMVDKIKVINNLYSIGHEIVYWTARGQKSKIDYYDLTHQQLQLWGAKFHKLLCTKPPFDLLIDDKTISKIEDLKCITII